METIPVSMRLSADIRALLGELANRDHRTMSGWVSAVVEREAASAGLNKEEISVKAKEKKVAAVRVLHMLGVIGMEDFVQQTMVLLPPE